MQTHSILLIGLIFFAGTTYSQKDATQIKALTFESALKECMQNNFGVKEAYNVSAIKLKEKQARKGLFMPVISLNANYTKLSDDLHLDLTPVKDAISPIYSSLGKYGNFSGVPNPDPNTNQLMPILPDNMSTKAVRSQFLRGLEELETSNWDQMIQKKEFGFVNASFTYPIYAGGKIRSANHAASIYYQEALNEESFKTSTVINELIERYFGLVLATEAVNIRQEAYSTLSNHLNDAKRLKEEGIIANAEYLHVNVYFSEANRELKKAKRQKDIINAGLLNTLSSADSCDIAPLSSLFYIDSIEPLSFFIAHASSNSEILKKVNYKKELAATKYELEKESFLPTIAAMGSYHLIDKDLSPYIPEYFIGIGLKWDIFQGLTRIRNMQMAQIQQEQVDNIYQKTTSDITTAITKNYEEMNMYLEQLHELESALVFTNEYYRVQSKAFSEGLATATEISDANLALSKVKIERLQTMYHFDLSLAKTLYYAGITDQFTSYMQKGRK